MGKYRLTLGAEEDLQNIYEWGFVTFGEERADTYHVGLLDRFDKIAENPLLGQAVDHLCNGARRAVYGKNAIYYQNIDDDVGILIIGIVGRQDVRKMVGQ